MKPFRPLVVIGGGACVFIGLLAVLSGGGTTQQVMEPGRALIVAGAILLAGAVIASAIAGQHK
jgi:hypothetical protein